MKFQRLIHWVHAIAALASFFAFIVSALTDPREVTWQFLTFLWILLSWSNYSDLIELKSKNKA